MAKKVTLVFNPIVERIAETRMLKENLPKVMEWLAHRRPKCLPDNYSKWEELFPHRGRRFPDDPSSAILVNDDELLVEFAGRKCYDSFGDIVSGQKTNDGYIKNTQAHYPPHRSIMYHPHITYFFAGISRRMAKELQRNYIGHAKDEEGSPSQESTRYTHHYGYYVVHPRDCNSEQSVDAFRAACQVNYDTYECYIKNQSYEYKSKYGKSPRGLDWKRIYECAAGLLNGQAETSFVWTTNPVAEMKLWNERCSEAADLEFQRFARVWRTAAVNISPNLYPGVSNGKEGEL